MSLTFDRFRNATQCPFAARSSWIVSAEPLSELVPGEYLAAARAGLARARAAIAEGTADGYALRLPASAGASVRALRSTTLAVLQGLASSPAEVDFARLEDPAWWFPYGEDRYFVVAFGPCFPPDHTRFTFGAGETFLVFEHLLAFSRRYPDGIPDGVRQTINRSFAEAGREYVYDMGVVPAVRFAEGES